jgi:DNA (cytosine-5)-methyltransferase 1
MRDVPALQVDDRPVLVDLYGGEGCSGWGYHLAGFRVVCVDLRHCPNNPLPSVQMGALEFLATADLSGVAAFGASPPCPARSKATPIATRGKHPALIGATREALEATGKPFIIENVPARKLAEPLRADIILCGCAFDLRDPDGRYLVRERHFETSWHAFDMRPPCHHRGKAVTVLTHGGRIEQTRPERRAAGAHRPTYVSLADSAALMGVHWPISEVGLGNGLPPAYTRYMGGLLMEHLIEAGAVPSAPQPWVPPHAGRPDGTCTCGTAGYLARLSCGCESWSHGEPPVGGYISCGTLLAHQTSYRVLSVRPGKAA